MHPTLTKKANAAVPPHADLRYRAGVASRATAAIGAGYLLSSLVTQALALALPLDPVDRVVAATLTGLVIYPCAIMWSFAAASTSRVWLALGGACTLASLAVLALRNGGSGA